MLSHTLRAGLLVGITSGLVRGDDQFNPLQYVNPLIGTANEGNGKPQGVLPPNLAV
jgi:hypothetical protein